MQKSEAKKHGHGPCARRLTYKGTAADSQELHHDFSCTPKCGVRACMRQTCSFDCQCSPEYMIVDFMYVSSRSPVKTLVGDSITDTHLIGL